MAQHPRVDLGSLTAKRDTVASLRPVPQSMQGFQLLLQRFGTLLENAVGGDAEGVLDLEELAELVEQRQGETGVAAQFDFHTGEGGLASA